MGIAATPFLADVGRFPTVIEWLYARNAPADLTKGELYPYLKSKAVYVYPTESVTPSRPLLGLVTKDHSYAMNCMMCHAHGLPACLWPAKTVYFAEATNLAANAVGSMATPLGVAGGACQGTLQNSPAFRHNQRELFVMVDSHVERKNLKQYNLAAKDSRFWHPNTQTDRSGGL